MVRLEDERTIQDCYVFLADLRSRLKVGNRIQLATDGLGIYPLRVEMNPKPANAPLPNLASIQCSPDGTSMIR